MNTQSDRFRGLILGTAVGDAIGLPAEGISRQRARKMFTGPWRHRLVCGYGMVSDDTEHTLFVTQCLLAHADDPDRFTRRLAFCLRWWFAALPAGIGLGTARAILRLWVGFPPACSGVGSAGNGPAMRVAPLGAYFADDANRLREMVRRCTQITHTDSKAEIGAQAIARMAAWIVRDDISQRPPGHAFMDHLRAVSPDAEWRSLVTHIDAACEADLNVSDFADQLGLERGVTGFIYHTVPVVLYAWYRHCDDFERTLTAVWECGGDTDTTGAIAGALAGLTVGESGIPREWIDGIREWPRSVGVMRAMADALARKASGHDAHPIRYPWPAIPLRNVVFLVIVLLHGFRRMLPP